MVSVEFLIWAITQYRLILKNQSNNQPILRYGPVVFGAFDWVRTNDLCLRRAML